MKLLISLIFFFASLHAHQPAVVIVPVADLVGAPIQTFNLAKTIKDSYSKIAICGGIPSATQGSPRIHQLLLHEQVEIISENGDEVCIIVPHVFFITHEVHKPQAIYWTLKKNLLTLKKINDDALKNIPEGPHYKNPTSINNSLNTIVLFKPFYDSATEQTVSAGTRFVIDPLKTMENYYTAYIFDRKTTCFKTTLIPKKIALELHVQTKQNAISCFVKLVQSWAHCINGPIPYVWGGCSFTHCCNHSFTEKKKKLTNGKPINIIERTECIEKPFSGFDCAGLITRAAHICGIPYYFKNTYTLAHYLKSLSIDQHLQEGDLIWIPGHVMIVSDIANNKLVEARGYSHNYGIVQEIPLHVQFKNINTYADLLKAYHHHTPLIRLNKSGDKVEEIKKFKILKLSSAWDVTNY